MSWTLVNRLWFHSLTIAYLPPPAPLHRLFSQHRRHLPDAGPRPHREGGHQGEGGAGQGRQGGRCPGIPHPREAHGRGRHHLAEPGRVGRPGQEPAPRGHRGRLPEHHHPVLGHCFFHRLVRHRPPGARVLHAGGPLWQVRRAGQEERGVQGEAMAVPGICCTLPPGARWLLLFAPPLFFSPSPSIPRTRRWKPSGMPSAFSRIYPRFWG